jgi:hypothetical protein
MTLAESNYPRFAIGSDAIVRLVRPSPAIGKSVINGCERAPPELV